MDVKLIRYTPEPELVIASAARVSASTFDLEGIMEKMTPEKASKLINKLISSGHHSPLEHASFTFFIQRISRVTSHQLVRHRLASYTQQSQRYVALKNIEYVIPPSIDRDTNLKSKFTQFMEDAHKLYQELLSAGIPAEDARYILPSGITTQLVMTMNARELLHTCGLRLCLKAQWEIIRLFRLIKEEVKKVAPTLGENLVPKCYRLGYCDEEKSCGLYPTRKEVLRSAS